MTDGSETDLRMAPTIDAAGRSYQPCAVITGAASGLGRALALRLAASGWRIALADVDLAGCRETAALVERAGGAARVESLDVANPEQWANLVERLQRDWDQLDLLVNNAGVACSGEIGDLPLADWRWTIEINLFGAIHGCHTCRDWLVRNPRGAHVVNIASAAAIVCAPSMSAYSVSKAGVVALSETLYAELRPRRVGVTVVCPGFFATNLLSGARFHTTAQQQSAARLMHSARISADDVARAIERAIARKQLYLMLPRRIRFVWLLRRLWPMAMMKLVARVAAKARRDETAGATPSPDNAPPSASAGTRAAGSRPG
jgi:NAD(P)-dependent dehydrogenase (short-subunit alcohol dehydrogenase family)